MLIIWNAEALATTMSDTINAAIISNLWHKAILDSAPRAIYEIKDRRIHPSRLCLCAYVGGLKTGGLVVYS